MRRKLKVSAESREALRAFLADADVDLGCRPVANREGDRVNTLAIAEDEEIASLSARRDGSVSLDVLEAVPPAETRRALVPGGNRFLAGERPHGFGEKR